MTEHGFNFVETYTKDLIRVFIFGASHEKWGYFDR